MTAGVAGPCWCSRHCRSGQIEGLDLSTASDTASRTGRSSSDQLYIWCTAHTGWRDPSSPNTLCTVGTDVENRAGKKHTIFENQCTWLRFKCLNQKHSTEMSTLKPQNHWTTYWLFFTVFCSSQAGGGLFKVLHFLNRQISQSAHLLVRPQFIGQFGTFHHCRTSELVFTLKTPKSVN